MVNTYMKITVFFFSLFSLYNLIMEQPHWYFQAPTLIILTLNISYHTLQKKKVLRGHVKPRMQTELVM